MADARHEFVMEFDAGLDPLSGRVRTQTGTHRSFVGWLGLASAIVRALEDDSGGPTAVRDQRTSATRSRRKPADAPHVEVSAETASALATVYAWGQAFNERVLDRLLALSAADFQIVTPIVSECGHAAVRRLLHLHSHGVAQQVRPRRYLARGSTVVIDAPIELRSVDGGELAKTLHEVGVFDVRYGRVSRLVPQPDMASALEAVGWTDQASVPHKTTAAPPPSLIEEVQ